MVQTKCRKEMDFLKKKSPALTIYLNKIGLKFAPKERD